MKKLPGILSITTALFPLWTSPMVLLADPTAPKQTLDALEQKAEARLRIAGRIKILEEAVKDLRAERRITESTRISTQPGEDPRPESPVSSHTATLKSIENCLDEASGKAKQLSEVLGAARQEKIAARVAAEKANGNLAQLQAEMRRASEQLATLEERDGKNQAQLQILEKKLSTAVGRAASESQKLVATAEHLVEWEKRANRAEDALGRTKAALHTTLKVAQSAKNLGSELQGKLALTRAELAERNERLNTTLASLEQTRAAAGECQARARDLQTVLEAQAQRLDVATASLKAAQGERDTLRGSLRTTERNLAQARGQLTSVRGRAEKVGALQKQIAELEKTLSERTHADAIKAREAARLAESTKKMKAQLDEILVNREELHDALTILRARFAQYQVAVQHSEREAAKQTLNQVQVALAGAQRAHREELQKRDARLAQLEKSLEAKERALQVAYKSERDFASKLDQSEKARLQETASRQSLTTSLTRLQMDLEASQVKACQLKEQLIDLEALSRE